MDLSCLFSVLRLLCLCARLFICALWSPAGKGLTSWLSFVVFYFEFVTFKTTSRYLDDILNINSVYFDNMVGQIYPSELQLNKTNTSDIFRLAFVNY